MTRVDGTEHNFETARGRCLKHFGHRAQSCDTNAWCMIYMIRHRRLETMTKNSGVAHAVSMKGNPRQVTRHGQQWTITS